MSVGALGIIIWLIYWAATRDRRQQPPPQGSSLGVGLAVLLWMFLGGLLILWTVQLLSGELAVIPKLLGAIAVLFPWPIVRLCLLPLGLLRTAYYASFLCLVRFQGDRRGAALVVAAWAMLRRPLPPEGGADPALQFFNRKLNGLKKMRGAAVVALGLAAARRGELDTAREFLESAFHLDPAACPRWALELAGEWLSVDAVARGDWAQVSAAATILRPRSRLTRFLRACADRFVITDEPSLNPPSDAGLYLRWLWAPYRQATWPLLQKALPSEPQPVAGASSAAPRRAEEVVSLSSALAQLAAVLRQPVSTLTQDQLVRVCGSWDAALRNPETVRHVTVRALSLGHSGPDAALQTLRTQVAAALSAILRESGLPVGRLLGDGPDDPQATQTGAAAAQAVRTQLLEEIEQTCDALHDRVGNKRILPITDEWREWAALRIRYHRVCKLGGLAVRRLAWVPMHREACNWAVWLWNERKEKVLANAVFRFLLAEAELLSDESRIALARKNVDCGI
mgnify:CR=1 FL=1